jgi:hypothetical protein
MRTEQDVLSVAPGQLRIRSLSPSTAASGARLGIAAIGSLGGEQARIVHHPGGAQRCCRGDQ